MLQEISEAIKFLAPYADPHLRRSLVKRKLGEAINDSKILRQLLVLRTTTTFFRRSKLLKEKAQDCMDIMKMFGE
jgi:hypothetical protein